MHLLVFTTFTAIITLAAALCAPDLPPIAEPSRYIYYENHLSLVIPVFEECNITGSGGNGSRLNFNNDGVELYQTTVINWLITIREAFHYPYYWQFACVWRCFENHDDLLITIRKEPGFHLRPVRCSQENCY